MTIASTIPSNRNDACALVRELSRGLQMPRQRPRGGQGSPVLSDIGAKAAAARAACTAAIDHVGTDPASLNECADLIAAARGILEQIEQLAAATELRAVE